MKYAIEQRLRFIDFLLDQYGNLNYDPRARYYYAQEGFKRVWP